MQQILAARLRYSPAVLLRLRRCAETPAPETVAQWRAIVGPQAVC